VRYADRIHAGEHLAAQLRAYADRADVTVLGLVRGGIPVAARVAKRLHEPLDALVICKLGVPWAPEVAFGALGPGGVVVHNPDVAAHLSEADITAVTALATAELARREARYRPGRPPLALAGRVCLVVDDGLATGASARAAVASVRRMGAVLVVVAAPVGAASSVEHLRAEADDVVCPLVPVPFGAVSRFYASFPQVTDAEVIALLTS
jgi:putative phosphoribosyl transferase